MKKIVIAFGILIISTLVINNLPKSTPPNENIVKEQTSPMSRASSANNLKEIDIVKSNSARYIDYSDTSYGQMSDKKRVFFFHANWCPTCKAANDEFIQNSDKIPPNVILFKTDYDTEKELKIKYDITYQHTFVSIDSSGDEIKKWNGGGIAELISNTTQ